MGSKIVVTYNEKFAKFYLQCPFYLNNIVRNLPNRRFVKSKGIWEAPALSRNADYLLGLRRSGQAVLNDACEKIIKEIQEKSSAIKKFGFPTEYKFKTNPYDHQRSALQATYGLDQSALYMEMGTGKSKVIIDTACAYFESGIIDAVLILCPVSIRTNWVHEFKTHGPIDFDIRVCEIKTSKQEKEIEQFFYTKNKLKVFIVGTQSLSRRDAKANKPMGKAWKLAEKFMLCHNAMMAVDEAHMIKNHDSNRARNAGLLGLMAKKRMVATGTPIAQGIMDLYMQFEFLSTNIVGIGDYYSFRNRYAVMGGYENKQIVGYDNLSELMELIKPWIFQCTKKEVLPDLPDKLYSVRRISLTTEQMFLYKKIKKERVAELPALNPDGSNVALVVENILVMNLALQQIVSGFVTYSQEGKKERQLEEIVGWKRNPKIQELLNILEEHKEKPAIIWARFRWEIAQITEALESKFGAGCVAEYHGGVSKEDRDINEQAFKSGGKRYFVSNQATGGVGLTLNAANLSIYLSNDFNYINRKQSEDRNHRIGQENKVLYVDIIAENTVDETIIQAIENKQNMSDFVKNSLAG